MNLTEKSSLQRSKDPISDKDSGIYEVTSNLSVASSLSSTSSRANRFRSTIQTSIATKEADDITPQPVSKSSRQYRDDSRYLYDVTSDVSYEKQRLIGEGGFALVYQVKRVDTGELLAAKVINKKSLMSPTQRQRVLNEIEVHSLVSDHPNILKFKGSFRVGDQICILSELCSRNTLVHFVANRRSSCEDEVAQMFYQIVQGVLHLHKIGIIHRDLKLANILQNSNKEIKIADFGMATKSSYKKSRTICGTPNLIPPEVFQRKGHDCKSDIWSLGCLLFALLIGHYPFSALRPKDTLKKICRGSFTIPDKVSSEASDLISKMLDQDPEARPSPEDILKHPFFHKIPFCNSESLKSPKSSKISEGYRGVCKKILSFASRSHKESLASTTTPSSDISSVKTSNPIIITDWVDYSNRYGFGYKLSDGRICVLFNDAKHLSLLPDLRTMEYSPSEQADKGIIFDVSQPPASLGRYLQSFGKIAKYLRGSDIPTHQPTTRVRLTTWSRDSDAVVMYLSNGSLQTKFFGNNKKILISDIHRISKINFHQIHEGSTSTLSLPPSAEDQKMISCIHKIFHQKLFEVECGSAHPFCDVISTF